MSRIGMDNITDSPRHVPPNNAPSFAKTRRASDCRLDSRTTYQLPGFEGYGFARARSLSPSGLLPETKLLSPFPKRLKCCVPCAVRTTQLTSAPRSAELGRWHRNGSNHPQ